MIKLTRKTEEHVKRKDNFKNRFMTNRRKRNPASKGIRAIYDKDGKFAGLVDKLEGYHPPIGMICGRCGALKKPHYTHSNKTRYKCPNRIRKDGRNGNYYWECLS